jgi:hypothetical protein
MSLIVENKTFIINRSFDEIERNEQWEKECWKSSTVNASG